MNTDKIYAEAVANEYSVKTTTKVVQLKKLDRRAKLPARLFGYIFGIFWTLVFGTGMCFTMGVIGESWGWVAMLVGCILGVLGIIGMSVNYPIYRTIINLCRAKKLSHPVLQALRNLNLVEALTAVIMLESTLITSFGTLDTSMRVIIIISGAVVCGFNLVLATLMIIKGSRTLLGNSDLPTA